MADYSFNVLPPREQPKDVGRRVAQIFLDCQAEKERLGLPALWNRNYRFGKGKHWQRKPSQVGNVPLSTADLLHLHRQRTVNTLTGNNPTFNVHRSGPEGDDETFSVLERLAAYWWCEQKQQSIFERSVINGETYGVAIEKVVFDPDLEYGLGEVQTIVVDPYYFGVYPVDTKDIQAAQAVVHVVAMDIREARRRWKALAKQIKPDNTILSQVNDTRQEVASGQTSGFLARFANVITPLINLASRGQDVDNDKCMVIECWAKNYSMGDDGPLYTGNIRCVTVCNAGSLVLDDRSNPSINPAMSRDEAIKTYLADKFPFSVANSITDTASIWGDCDFNHLIPLQTEINKCLSQITYMKDQAARSKIINPRDSGVPDSAFTNRQGIIKPTSMATGQGIRYLDFPLNTQDVQLVLQMHKDFFLQVGGVFDLERADTPGRDVIAAKAIAALIEQTNIMSAGKLRNYGLMLTERGRMFISHVQNWYTEKRWITFSDSSGQTQLVSINGTAMRIPATLTVVNGSTMPVSKIQQREEALALFRENAIDREELLKRLDWDNPREVLERMNAGPVGQAIQNLKTAGILPPGAADQAMKIGTMDPKDVAKAIQAGEIKPLPPEGQQPHEPDPQAQMEQQEQALTLQKLQAEIRKIAAECEEILARAEAHKAEAMKTAADAQVAGQREQRETLQAVGEIHRSAEQHRHDLEMDRQKMIQDRVKGVNDAAQQQHAPPMPVQATSPTIPASPQPYPITPPTE